MIFVMDESESIGSGNFEKIRNLAINVTDSFVIGPEYTQVGWINFAGNARIIFNLNTHQTKESLHEAIHAVPYIRGGTGTNITEGLLALYNHGFVSSAGAHNGYDVLEVAIVVTDGRSDIEPIREAAALLRRNRNIDMFVVGVGDGIEYEQLQAVAEAGIASDTSQNIFTLTGFEEEQLFQLQEILNERIPSCFSELTFAQLQYIIITAGCTSPAYLLYI